MPDFCVFQGGELQFTHPSGFKGSVTVQFSGPQRKKADIKVQAVLKKTYHSCSFLATLPTDEFLPAGVQGVYDLGTPQVDTPCTVGPFYSNGTVCRQGAGQPTTQFPDGSKIESQSEGYIQSSWLFVTPGGDTVGIIIQVENQTGGGPGEEKQRKHYLMNLTLHLQGLLRQQFALLTMHLKKK